MNIHIKYVHVYFNNLRDIAQKRGQNCVHCPKIGRMKKC